MFKKILFISLLLVSQSLYTQTVDTLIITKKSPWGAVLRSSILPGWGQIYNQSYWKAPIIWGAIGWFGYNWVLNNRNYNDYKNLYFNSVLSGQENFLYKRIRDFYRDQRDLIAIYLGLAYFLNMVDAYVDAHLFNFDLLTTNNEIKLNLQIHF